MGAAAPAANAAAWAKCFATAAQEEGSEVEARGMAAGDGAKKIRDLWWFYNDYMVSSWDFIVILWDLN